MNVRDSILDRKSTGISPAARRSELAPDRTQPGNRPLRVLYYYAHQHFDTGSPKALFGFIDALDDSVVQPVFLASGDGPLLDAFSARGVEIVPFDVSGVSYRRPLRAVHSVLRKAARLQELRADLLHVMGFEWNLDAVLAAWLQGIPVVLHVHVPESADFKNLHRFAASKVLFCSNFEKQNFSRLDRIQSKAEVLHNCIDVNQYANGTSIRPALGIKESDIVIGTVAQLTHRKGIDLLLDAAEILLASTANLVFLIVGRGHPEEREFESRVRARAELAAMKGRVCFLGSRSDVPDLLASMDLFLLPSRAEPFGIVILEAMAAGLPVVASAVGGIPEIITSGELGCLVEPLTGDSFAAAINKMLETPDRGRAMGQRARQSLYGRFDKAAVGRKLQRIYSDLVSAKRDLRISPRESRNS